MNAQKQLAEMSERVRNLTIERDALKSKCEVQRKALAHEAMETAKLRAENSALKESAGGLVVALNKYHTVNDLHPAVLASVKEVNKLLDAELLK